MRIAILTGQFPAVSETFVFNHVQSLIERGHKVTVLAFKDETSKFPQYATVTPGFDKIVRPLDPVLTDRSLDRVLYRFRSLLIEGWQNPGTTLRSFDPRIGGSKAFNLSLYGFTRAFKSKDEFDILHCHFGWFGILGAMLKKTRAFNSKLVISFHGADVNVSGAMGSDRNQKLMFDIADGFTANTNFTRDQAVARGCPRERCSIWHMGVNMHDFSFRKRILTDGEPIRIITVARLAEKKGIEYAIRALALVKASGRKVEYHIVGDGPLRANLEQLAEELGVRSQVIFHGSCSTESVRQHLDRSHIFVLPSVTAKNNDREGQGVALIEAEASGMPIVATKHNGFPEAMLDGVTGYLVPERDPTALAERLSYLIAHPGSWGPMGMAGRTFVEREFALDACTNAITSLYEQLLSRPG